MSTITARTAIAESLSSHLYTCNQSNDPCYEIEPREGESWRELAERRAAHVARLVDAAIVLPGSAGRIGNESKE